MAYREGEPDLPPLGPFKVRGVYEVKREERDVPLQRFLILSPLKGCKLPTYEEYAVEYPKKLIAGDIVTFERKGGALRIRVELSGKGFCILQLRNENRPVQEYVVYEQQVEGTWIPIEVDGDLLRP